MTRPEEDEMMIFEMFNAAQDNAPQPEPPPPCEGYNPAPPFSPEFFDED